MDPSFSYLQKLPLKNLRSVFSDGVANEEFCNNRPPRDLRVFAEGERRRGFFACEPFSFSPRCVSADDPADRSRELEQTLALVVFVSEVPAPPQRLARNASLTLSSLLSLLPASAPKL